MEVINKEQLLEIVRDCAGEPIPVSKIWFQLVVKPAVLDLLEEGADLNLKRWRYSGTRPFFDDLRGNGIECKPGIYARLVPRTDVGPQYYEWDLSI